MNQELPFCRTNLDMQMNFFENKRCAAIKFSSGFPEKLVLLDCETTGVNPSYHRIIEVGVLIIENSTVIKEWQTFINPEVNLPENIQKLTGITPAMVRDAPLFSSIAEELFAILEGRTLVAHNAKFDYAFLRKEFQRLGIDYACAPLCSVKLSRTLYPHFNRHGLSAIISRFGFSIVNRHRALDDARVISLFFLKSSEIFSEEEIFEACKKVLKRPSLPSSLKHEEIEKLPSTAGVYYFYDTQFTLLYIGKSINIRNRVLTHFNSETKSSKNLRMYNKVAHIDFEETPGDFGAQIRENEQIKSLKPLYNRKLQKYRQLFHYCTSKNIDGYLNLTIEPVKAMSPDLSGHFGLFRSPRHALKQIEKLADQHLLCHQMLGLEEKTSKPCFRSQLKRCLGACHGAEPAELYNERLNAAIKVYQLKSWPYRGPIVLVESDPLDPDNIDFHVIDRWLYIRKLAVLEDIFDLGFAFADSASYLWEISANPKKNQTAQNDSGQEKLNGHFDLDTYFIILRFISNSEKMALNHLKIWPLVRISEIITEEL